MKTDSPPLHTPGQEKHIREMVDPLLNIIQSEYGAWGLDVVRDICQGRILEMHQPQDTHRT